MNYWALAGLIGIGALVLGGLAMLSVAISGVWWVVPAATLAAVATVGIIVGLMALAFWLWEQL